MIRTQTGTIPLTLPSVGWEGKGVYKKEHRSKGQHNSSSLYTMKFLVSAAWYWPLPPSCLIDQIADIVTFSTGKSRTVKVFSSVCVVLPVLKMFLFFVRRTIVVLSVEIREWTRLEIQAVWSSPEFARTMGLLDILVMLYEFRSSYMPFLAYTLHTGRGSAEQGEV